MHSATNNYVVNKHQPINQSINELIKQAKSLIKSKQRDRKYESSLKALHRKVESSEASRH